jgi:hypothetical protein
MVDFLLIVAVVIIILGIGVPLKAKLRTTKDGFIFRSKLPDEFRFADRQEEIDELALRLQSDKKNAKPPSAEDT